MSDTAHETGGANPAAQARRQEHIESLCAASMRALSGRRDLHFRARRVHAGERALPLWAPHLAPALATTDFAVFRGAADGVALRLGLSDAALHARLAPPAATGVERTLFEIFEQLRVEALAPADLPGVRHNLARCFEHWSLAFHAAGHTAGARGLLMYAIVQMLRARLNGTEAIEPDEGLLEATRASLGPAIGTHLVAMKRAVHDQARYAEPARALAAHIAQMLASADAEDGGAAQANDEDDGTLTAFNFWIENAPVDEERAALAAAGESKVLADAPGGYRVFTRAHDREVAAASLLRKEQLAELRRELDERLAATRINTAQLARELKALLARPTVDDWTSGEELGHIDGRRLARLIASPTDTRIFRTERIVWQADATVSLLIDCSGSMRQHAPDLAVMLDRLTRALEMAGVASEVLGFTTGAWNGGRAQRDWMRAGRPRHPGRLNEALHIVFKSADTPWRRARPSLAALLKPDLFREGLDGEAVLWARQRLEERRSAHADERQLLIVISDGSPMDSATHLANDLHYLDHHLRQVVAQHERAGGEIYGLGVGLDLSPYYRRSHVLDLSAGVGMRECRELMAMIARQGPRGR